MLEFFSEYSNVKSILIYGDTSREKADISFVIPTYKRPNEIQRAIRSILNQQTDKEYDVIVVDNEADRETETENVLEHLCNKHQNLYYYKNEQNIGMFPNWNRCYELATSTWCCICMSDDELKSDYLDKVMGMALKHNLDCVRVGADILDQNEVHVDEKSILDKRYHNRKNCIHIIDNKYFVFRGALPPSGMLVKRECVIKLGGYNRKYFPGSDYEFDTRLVAKYRVGMLWDRLCITHTGSSTSMVSDVKKQSIHLGFIISKKVYDKHFKNKRLLNAVNNVRAFIAIDKEGLDPKEYPELDIKYNKSMYRNTYRVLFLIYRMIETIS